MDTRELIEALGGVNAVARMVGHKYPTRVSYWRRVNYISNWADGELVLKAAKKKGINVKREDLLK